MAERGGGGCHAANRAIQNPWNVSLFLFAYIGYLFIEKVFIFIVFHFFFFFVVLFIYIFFVVLVIYFCSLILCMSLCVLLCCRLIRRICYVYVLSSRTLVLGPIAHDKCAIPTDSPRKSWRATFFFCLMWIGFFYLIFYIFNSPMASFRLHGHVA